MADFQEVMKRARDGYCDRKDYPKWDDRRFWDTYLEKIAAEIDAEAAIAFGLEVTQ